MLALKVFHKLYNRTMNFSAGRVIHINRNGYLTFGILFTVIVLLFYGFSYSDDFSRNLKLGGHFKEYVNMKELLSACIDAARRGGLKVYQIRESASLKEKSKGKTAEGANDPVTDGDMQSHREMYFSLKNAFPQITIISEEKSSHAMESDIIPADTENKEVDVLLFNGELVKANDIQVWIDPLDATQEYTEDLREYVTTMVCVAVKGVPTIGVIHSPFSDFTAWAWVNRGHSSKLKVYKVEKVDPERPVRVIVSRSHSGEVASKAEAAFGKSVKVTPAGGAGFKTLEVLNGRQDVYFHSTLIKKWDICAGNAILNHFRGRMTTLDGSEIDYSSPLEYKNEGGLVASLNNHMYYLQKLNNR